jgi:hypothetical protein
MNAVCAVLTTAYTPRTKELSIANVQHQISLESTGAAGILAPFIVGNL